MSNETVNLLYTERSYALLGPFYTACLLKQVQGEEWDADSVLEEVLEMRRKIFEAL